MSIKKETDWALSCPTPIAPPSSTTSSVSATPDRPFSRPYQHSFTSSSPVPSPAGTKKATAFADLARLSGTEGLGNLQGAIDTNNAAIRSHLEEIKQRYAEIEDFQKRQDILIKAKKDIKRIEDEAASILESVGPLYRPEKSADRSQP